MADINTTERLYDADNGQSFPTSNVSHESDAQHPVAFPIRQGRPLTARQSAILEFINAHRAARGYPPTMREIGKAFSIRSTNGVNDHLRALERKGYISRRDMTSRGIRVVSQLTGQPTPDVADPVLSAIAFVSAENEALRSLVRRLLSAASRLPLTAEMVIILGDARDALRAQGGT